MLHIPERKLEAFGERSKDPREFEVAVGALHGRTEETLVLERPSGGLIDDGPTLRILRMPACAHEERSAVRLEPCAGGYTGFDLLVEILHEAVQFLSSVRFTRWHEHGLLQLLGNLLLIGKILDELVQEHRA